MMENGHLVPANTRYTDADVDDDAASASYSTGSYLSPRLAAAAQAAGLNTNV